MFAVSPDHFVLVSQVFVVGLIVVTSAMWSYDMGRTISWAGPVSSLLWSGVMLLLVSLFTYCMAGGYVSIEFVVSAMSYGALVSVIFNIVGYIDDMNGSKLKWLLSSAN